MSEKGTIDFNNELWIITLNITTDNQAWAVRSNMMYVIPNCVFYLIYAISKSLS